MNKEDRDRRIMELEAEWQIYHRTRTKGKMPNMMELAKLRAERDTEMRIKKHG